MKTALQPLLAEVLLDDVGTLERTGGLWDLDRISFLIVD